MISQTNMRPVSAVKACKRLFIRVIYRSLGKTHHWIFSCENGLW